MSSPTARSGRIPRAGGPQVTLVPRIEISVGKNQRIAPRTIVRMPAVRMDRRQVAAQCPEAGLAEKWPRAGGLKLLNEPLHRGGPVDRYQVVPVRTPAARW